MPRLPRNIKRILRVRGNLRDQVTEDIESEIHFHLESRIEELTNLGASRDEARKKAIQEFGDVETAKHRLRQVSIGRERTLRQREWISDLTQDIRFGWRKLLSQPVFAAVAILTLALGIGANVAVFTVVQSVLLQPLPYAAPKQLVSVWEVAPGGNDRNVVSRGNYMDWRDQTTSFEDLGAYGLGGGATLLEEGTEPTRVTICYLTPSTFKVLQTDPLMGRTFTEDEGLPENAGVALLGESFYQRRFGGADVLGRKLLLDEGTHMIVGVMPARFAFPDTGIDIWVPWPLDEESRQSRRSHNLRVIGRLKSGIGLETAQAELDVLAARAAELYPEHMAGWGVNVQPFREDLVASSRPLLLVLLGVAGLVLLLACANLSNLLLARALSREREIALRLALGAGRSRLIRQFLTEAGLIALIGGSLGVAATVIGLDSLLRLAPADIPLLENTRVSPAALGFATGVTVLSTLLFGLLPALRITSFDLQSTLRSAGQRTAGTHAPVRTALLIAEVSLAAILLVGAGLLLRSFVSLYEQDYGLNRENLFVATLDLPASRYGGGRQDYIDFYQRLMERIQVIPGVISAAGSTDLPAGFSSMTFSYAIEGQPRPGPRPREEPQPLRIVTPAYFKTLQIPLLAGRVFNEHDDRDAPAAIIINEALKKLHWADSDPVGQRLSFEGPAGPWLEIVGVVGNTRHYSMDAEPSPALFIPHAQLRWDWTSWLNVLVRVEGDPLALTPSFRSVLREMDDQLVPGRMARLVDLYAETNARRDFALALMAMFAALALVLGSLGVYGIMSYSVTQQTREIGIRMALGASRKSIASKIIGQGLRISLAGVVIGLVGAFLLSRFLETLVYGVTTTDPTTFILVPLVLLLVATLASYVPARRALLIDPIQALSAD